MKFQENDVAYIVENHLRVTPVRVVRVSAGLYTISLGEGKAIRLSEGRLFATAAEAEKHVRKVEKTPEV